MKDTMKKCVYVIGFVPFVIYAMIVFVFLINHALRWLGWIFPIITILNFVIPYCLSKQQYQKIGFVFTVLISIIHFYFATLPQQTNPNTTAFFGVFFPCFYSLYDYLLKKW